MAAILHLSWINDVEVKTGEMFGGENVYGLGGRKRG